MKILHQPLTELREVIRETRIDDGLGKEKIARLTEHLELVLGDHGSAPGPHHKSLQAALQDAILHFEVSHPKLTTVMQSVVSALPWV